MKKICLLILTLILSLTAFAQNSWTATSGPYGGNIQRLKKAPNGNLYAVISQKLWRSTNNGDSWTEVIPTSPTSLFLNDVMIDADGTLYAAYWSQLFSSSDNGVTWTIVGTNLFQNVQFIDRVGPDNVFAVWGYSGLYVSIDKGISWTQLSTLDSYGEPGLWSNAAGDIFYSTWQELYRHPYSGLTANWLPANLTPIVLGDLNNDTVDDFINEGVRSITFDLSGNLYMALNYNFYLSDNNGDSFTLITNRFQIGNTNLYYTRGILGTASDGNVYYFANDAYNSISATYYKAQYKSTDNGVNWSVIDAPTNNTNTDVNNIAFATASTFYIGSAVDGVFKTTDSGANWQLKNSGMTEASTQNIVVANSTGTVIATTTGAYGYWSSANGGTTWDFNSISGYVNKVGKLANGTVLLYGNGSIFRSTDNGASFSSDNIYRSNNYVIVEAANGDLYTFYHKYINPDYVPTIAKSTDSGATWSDLTITGLPAKDYNVNQAGIDGSDNMIIHGWDNTAAAYKTYKLVGTTATLLTMPNTNFIQNVFYQDNKFYASQSSTYFYTSDLGTTWTTVGFSGNYVFPLKNATYSGIAVSRPGALYISQDEGNSWANTLLPGSTATITSIATDATGDFYASGSKSPVLKFTNELLVDPTTLPPYINFNWQPLNGPFGGNINKIEISPDGNTMFAISQNRLWKHSNDVWTKIEPVATNGNIWDVEIDVNGAVYVMPTLNPVQKIYKSVDNGASWTALNSSGLASGLSNYRRMEVLTDGSILVFGADNSLGRIYKSSDGGDTFTLTFSSAFNLSLGSDHGSTASRKPTISPTNGTIVIFSVIQEGMLVSTDNGTSWTIKSTSEIASTTNGFVGSYMYDKDGNLIIHTIVDTTIPLWDARISKSSDDGSTWTTLPTPNILTPTGTNYYSKRVITLSSGEYLMCMQSIFDCYRSADGGSTWTNIGNVGDVFLWATSNGNVSYIVGSGNAGILKTTDGGLTYSAFSNGIPHPGARSISLINDKDLLVGATRPYYSSDFGQNFTLTTLEPATNYIKVQDSLIGYGSGKLLSSRDGGKTWKSFGAYGSFLTYLTADATGLGFYNTTGATINYSTDLINWVNITLSGLPTSYTILNMVIDEGGVIYTVIRDATDGNKQKLYKIVFGSGTDISTLVGTTNPAVLRYFNNNIYLYDTRGIIYKSSDGETWTSGTAPTGNTLLITNNYLFIPANGQVLWVSRNDGGSWQSVGEPLVAGAVQQNFIDIVINEYDGYAYAAVINGVAKKSGNIVIPDDLTKPVATAFSPTNNATDQGLKPTLSITFDEATNPVPGKLMRVFDSTQPALPVLTFDVSTATQSGKTWSIPITSNLAFNKTYFIVLDVAAFADLFGNTSNAISSSTAWRFTTKVSPVVSALAPALFSFNAPLNTTLTVTFSEPVTGLADKNLGIYKSSSPSIPVTTLAATSGVATNNNLAFTLPSSLEFNTTYFVKFDASAFSTTDGGAFSALTQNTDWSFTTRGTPTYSTLPTNGETGVPINTTLSITFSEVVSLDGSKKLYVTDTAQPATPVVTVNLSDASVSETTATFTLPNALSYSTQYEVTVDPNSFISSDGGSFSLLTSGSWQFTTVAAPDTQAPTIIFSPSPLISGEDKLFSPGITDNIGVTQAKIFYRSITSTGAESSANLVLNVSSGKYDVNIPKTEFKSMGLEYYFTASDAANNSARSPSDGYHYSYINSPADLQIPGGLVGVGGEIDDWKIISIPHTLSDDQIATVFSELGTVDLSQWRLITYKDPNTWDQYPTNFSTFARGKGYFINTKTLPVEGLKIDNATTPSFSKSNPYLLVLNPGWNQIGNPYTFKIVWSEVLDANSNVLSIDGIGTSIKKYKGTYIDDETDIDVFEGAFVVNSGASSVTLTVPVTGSNSGGRVASYEMNYDISGDNWITPITIKAGELVNTFGGVGMHTEAKVGIDNHDDFNPPPLDGYAQISFAHPEHFLKESTRDVVPTQLEYKWDLTVDTNVDGPIELIWDNTKFGENSKELFLVDVANGTLVDMRKQGTYITNTNHSSFEIHFGENLASKISPRKIILGEAYPNPGNGDILIPFSLPEHQTTYMVALEVFDQLGRKVIDLIDQSLPSGFYNSRWESDQYNLNAGVYLYRLTVQSNGKVETYAKKFVLSK